MRKPKFIDAFDRPHKQKGYVNYNGNALISELKAAQPKTVSERVACYRLAHKKLNTKQQTSLL